MVSRACILALGVTLSSMMASASIAGTAPCRHHHFDIVPHFDVTPITQGYYLRQIFACKTRNPGESVYVPSYIEDPILSAPRPYPDIDSAVRAVHRLYRPAIERWVPARMPYAYGEAWQAGFGTGAPPGEYRDARVYRQPPPKAKRPAVPRISYDGGGLNIDILSPTLVDITVFGLKATPGGRLLKVAGMLLK